LATWCRYSSARAMSAASVNTLQACGCQRWVLMCCATAGGLRLSSMSTARCSG
jgi:hypothetical protein